MSFAFLDPWHLFLPREGGHVIGFMGAEGREDLMAAVAAACRDAGVPVALVRTVAGAALPSASAVGWDDLAGGGTDALPSCVLVTGPGGDPASGLSADQVDELGGLLSDRVVLAAVDGPCAEPLRILPPTEPVWPARTSLAVLGLGVGAVGGRLERQVRDWDGPWSSPLADLPGHTVLEWDHLVRLLLDGGGCIGRLPPGVPTVLALSGLAGQEDTIGLFGFCDRAMGHPALPLAIFSSETPDGLEIRAACRPGGPAAG